MENLKDMTSVVKLGKFRTAYIYWKDVNAVQVGNKRILSPKMEHVPLKTSTLSINESLLLNYLDSGNVTRVFREMCDEYNATLDEILNLAISDWMTSAKGKPQSTSFWLIFFLVIAFMGGVIAWLLHLHIKLGRMDRNFMRSTDSSSSLNDC